MSSDAHAESVSYQSTSSEITGIGNWRGNPVVGKQCDSEVAVFSSNGAAQVATPERRWTSGNDTLDYTLGAAIHVPASVWVVYADKNFADEKAELESEFKLGNDILTNGKCGIALDATYFDKTAALADPTQQLGCADIAATLKPKVGFHANKMNVYIVKQLQADDRAGVACLAESDNVIVLDEGRPAIGVVHEFGHWFDLSHTTTESMPLVDAKNLMSQSDKENRDMITAGQCYRANFSKDSYINKRGLRSGTTKACKHAQDADEQCPGLKNEF